MQFIGTIKEIYTEVVHKTTSKKVIEKKVVILKMERDQMVSIQFQGINKDLPNGYSENQEVVIDAIFRGQRTSKRFYDNIVGQKIVKF